MSTLAILSIFSLQLKMEGNDKLANCVCYFRLALQRADGTIAPVRLNLLRIYREKRDVWPLKYDPQQFGSANIRIECRSLGHKNVAALIFSTGKVVCPGPSSQLSGFIMAHVITAEVSRVLGAPLCMRGFQIPNYVGTVYTHPVDIRSMADVLGDAKTRYEPDGSRPFPACFVYPHKDSLRPDRVVYLVFDSGKVVITGCRSNEDMIANMREVRQLCALFPRRALNAMIEEPSRLAAADQAMRLEINPDARTLRALGPVPDTRPVFSAGVQYTTGPRMIK